MVPNQRQLFIVVSDWGSYLGSHFPIVIRGILSIDSCMSALLFSFTLRLVFLFGVHLIKENVHPPRCTLVHSFQRT